MFRVAEACKEASRCLNSLDLINVKAINFPRVVVGDSSFGEHIYFTFIVIDDKLLPSVVMGKRTKAQAHLC